MTFPGTRFEARPVDLPAAIRFLRYTKAKVSPRAIRYEFHPDRAPELVLEPWEHRIPFKGSHHGYLEPPVIRLWGRRRLRLLEPLLPFPTGSVSISRVVPSPAFTSSIFPG